MELLPVLFPDLEKRSSAQATSLQGPIAAAVFPQDGNTAVAHFCHLLVIASVTKNLFVIILMREYVSYTRSTLQCLELRELWLPPSVIFCSSKARMDAGAVRPVPVLKSYIQGVPSAQVPCAVESICGLR